MPFQWKTHQGAEYLYVDYRGMTKEADLLATMEASNDAVRTLKEVRVLLDLNGASITSLKFMENAKREAATGVVANNVAKLALIGITGLKAVLASAFLAVTDDKKAKVFDNEAAALDWLVS